MVKLFRADVMKTRDTPLSHPVSVSALVAFGSADALSFEGGAVWAANAVAVHARTKRTRYLRMSTCLSSKRSTGRAVRARGPLLEILLSGHVMLHPDMPNSRISSRGPASGARDFPQMPKKSSAAKVLVLLDFRLPDSNDLKLLSRVRQMAPATHVILMTAYGTPEVMQGALDLGAFRVVGKPFEMNDLAALVFGVMNAFSGRPQRS